MAIKYLKIVELKPHEKTNKKNLEMVKADLLHVGCVKNPIIVDKEHNIILDGHHRTKALHELGYRRVPAILVDYFDDEIIVLPRKKWIKISKEIIVKKVLQNKIFPYKTSRHLIPNLPKKSINVLIERLK